MQRASKRLLVSSLLLVAACGPGADKPAASADSAAPATPAADSAAAPAGPQAIVTVIYQTPKDTAAFETYYREKHIPLVSAGQQEIGYTKAELTRFTSSLDGKKPALYRQAELYFPSLDAAKTGMQTEAFKKVAADLDNFETKGRIGLLAVETGDRGSAPCPVLVTVLYNTPKDTTAFETYYPKHLETVGAGRQEIGFTRADLTKFVSNLDGSAPARYRQAELCFNSMDDLEKGTATPAFKKVGDDFANFVSNGLTGLVGEQQ